LGKRKGDPGKKEGPQKNRFQRYEGENVFLVEAYTLKRTAKRTNRMEKTSGQGGFKPFPDFSTYHILDFRAIRI